MIDVTNGGVNIRFSIDGHWHPLAPRMRVEADPVVTVFKKLGNLNEKDRRNKQEAKYDLEHNGVKYSSKSFRKEWKPASGRC